jgi:trimeric autotransporter adhesin
MTTIRSIKSIGRSPLRLGFLLIALALACFAVLPTAQAVVPAPDGGYPGNNTAEGEDALSSLTTGTDNTAMGFHALYSNTTGSLNTANGVEALHSNTTGLDNTANGWEALFSNTTANGNTANGADALFSNTTGAENTANGATALFSNTTGFENTANGFGALFSNTTGSINTATGFSALSSNTTGADNTANGWNALFSNTTANGNTANGADALFSNTTGAENTANGATALFSNTTGFENTANGFGALFNNTSGSNNIALGNQAGQNLTTGNFNIAIGNAGIAGDANTIRIGTQGTQTKTFIAGITGTTIPHGTDVSIDANGRLGVKHSSKRFKDEIKPMDKASEAILALKPVTFRYKKEIDPKSIPQFGLVAEDVEKVNPDLVVRDKEGKPYTVRYDQVNAMLLNEFLKEHRKVQKLEAALEAFNKRLREQDAKIRRVNAQIEVNERGTQTVAKR